MHQDELALFGSIADAVGATLRTTTDWGPSGTRSGQYSVDLVVDQIVLDSLGRAGFDVLSEESGVTGGGSGALVIVDPLDGSTNASRGVPWYATSLALVEGDVVVAGLVRNQANGATFTAVRGEGAWCDGVDLRPSRCLSLDAAIVGVSGLAPHHLGWSQYRALGAAALDLCLVAAGALDGFVDCSVDAHGVWDYAAAWLICTEAGAVVLDAHERDLLVRDPAVKRTPIAAATPHLLAELLAARRTFV